MKKIIARISLIAIVLIGMTPVTPVKAVTTYYAPTTAFAITQVEAYNNAMVSNDQLWIISFTIGYPTANITPAIPIDDTFIFRVSDNTTLYGVTTAYGFFQNGYGLAKGQQGIASIYFAPADAPTWGSTNITTYFEGNPTLFWDGGVVPYISSSAVNWISTSSITATRNRLTTRLLYLASVLETDWGGTNDLVTNIATGQVLTVDGEEYFTNTISNLRSIVPDIFYQSMSVPTFPDDTLVLDYYEGGANTTLQVHGVNWFAQTFTATDSYPISGVQLPLYRTGNPGTINIYLRATAGNLPAGGNLATATYDGNTLTTDTSGQWIATAFTSDYDLNSGTVYAIVVSAPAGALANRVNWLVNTSAGYANGQECSSVNSGVAWAAVPANDALFELLVRGGDSLTLGQRYAINLLGTTFDVTRISTNWGIGNIWITTLFWLAISLAIIIAIAFATDRFGFWFIVFAFMIVMGWRAGFSDTNLLIGVGVLSSFGIIYGLFWKRSY